MAEKKIVCHCGLPILLRWQEARGSALYSFTCPECSNGHEIVATPPIQVHRVDATGNWELAKIIGETIR
jgi:hypothetical protein